MTIEHRQVSIGTAVAEIVGSDNMIHEVHVHNNNSDNAHILYLGGSAVTTSTGLRLGAQETLTMNLGPEDRLYAVSNHTATVVSVLDIRKAD
jgi:hypothetical protein